MRIPQEQTPHWLPQRKSHLTTARDTFDMENGYVNRVWPYISTLSSPFSFSFRTTYMISWHRYHTPNPPTPCIIWHIFLHYPLNHYRIPLLKSQLYFSSAYDHTRSTLSSPFWFSFRISFRTKKKNWTEFHLWNKTRCEHLKNKRFTEKHHGNHLPLHWQSQ